MLSKTNAALLSGPVYKSTVKLLLKPASLVALLLYLNLACAAQYCGHIQDH